MQSKILREKKGGGGRKNSRREKFDQMSPVYKNKCFTKNIFNKLRVNFLEQYKQGCLIPYSVLNFNPYYILNKISNIWHNRSENAVNNLKNKINCNYLISGNILFSMLADLARPGRFP